MKNKKAELNAIAIVILIVFIGLGAFFIIKNISGSDDKVSLNVTKLNDTTVTSTATQLVNPKTGGVNVTGGTDLTIKVNQTINQTNSTSNSTKNLTLVKVIYPNKQLTPGLVMSTNVTEICVSGYSDSVRNVSQSTRDRVYRSYNLSTTQQEGSFEIDHLVPLSIGGSNDIKNLWPQPRDPRPGYKEKDVLENYYHRQVCDGKMDIKEAQAIMATNWFQGYLKAREEGGIK